LREFGDILVPDALFLRAVVSLCEYKDSAGQDQMLDIAVAFLMTNSPHVKETFLLSAGWRGGEAAQESYLRHLDKDYFPFEIQVVFGLPSRASTIFFAYYKDMPLITNFRAPQVDVLNQLYTSTQLEQFAQTGDPALVNELLVPIMTTRENFSFHCSYWTTGCYNFLNR
jgi:hypothetical protein